MKKILKGIGGILCFFCLLLLTAGTVIGDEETDLYLNNQNVTDEAFQISFEQEYAEIGKPLTVTVNRNNVSYQWKIDGYPIKNSGSSYTPSKEDLEKWIEVTVKWEEEEASTRIYFSKLPVVYIDTHDGQPVTSKEDYKDADLKIQGNAEYDLETTVLYDGLTEIRGRGSTTWGLPKKPYRLKLDKKADLFGMGKNKHWVLLANYWDESLMRNTYAYDLSGDMGMEHVSTVWVDVVFNGEYAGNYQLCEQIRVDDTRVDIFDWEAFAEDTAAVIAETEGFTKKEGDELEDFMKEEDMSWITSGVVEFENNSYLLSAYPQIQIPSINGGYLLEVDQYFDEVSKFKTETDQPIMIKNPEFACTNADMMQYLKSYIQAFEDSIHASDYKSGGHYSEYVDMDSLIDYWLITEIFFNAEIGNKSTYMYQEIGELFQMGPIWDMDWSSNGMGDTYYTDKWGVQFFGGPGQDDNWFRYLVKDPYFLIKAQERYWDIRNHQISTMLERFDKDYEYLKESAEANGSLWGYDESYRFYVDKFRDWMIKHLFWLDEQMKYQDVLCQSLGYKKDGRIVIKVRDVNDNELEKDSAETAPADFLVEPENMIQLMVTGIEETASVFVNGIFYCTVEEDETISILPEILSAESGEKNLIEVKILKDKSVTTASNFITLREKEIELPIEEEVRFTDVSKGKWYYEPILWAVNKKITSGYSDTLFGTNDSCTRAQIVTFLWRAAGSPVSDSEKYSRFTDVKESSYYSDAVQWAVDQGITTGYSDTEFAPDDPCTRAQIVTFLWRASGSEMLENSEILFADVRENSYYYMPVLWAVDRGITTGYSKELFAPDTACTRAESVTFLYRNQNYN